MGSKTVHVSGFPMNVTADSVKNFLEDYTGEGSVFAVKVRHPKVISTRSRAYALVQFFTSKDAKIVSSLAQQNFLYGNSYLKVEYAKRDIVPKPRKAWFILEDTELHIGCLISENTLGVLWSCTGVEVHFGFNMKKISFLLTQGSQSHKLELSFESIWDIQQHSLPSENSQFLVVQVQAAPRIFEAPVPLQNSALVHEDPSLNYYKELQDDQWIRTTDFTPLCSIGQSFALCLELPYGCRLPDFHDFLYFKKVVSHFNLKRTHSYSRNSDLVPIIEPWNAIEIPYKFLFKINTLVQNGTLMGPTLNDEFFRYISPLRYPIGFIEYALGKMARWTTSNFNPAKWLNDQYVAYKKSNIQPPSPEISDTGLVYIHRVQITPSKVYFFGPEINVSNRVIRHYSEDIDNFIRVSFVEEDSGKIRSSDLAPRSSDEKRTKIYKRILNVLKNGIIIGDKKFEFLAFSSSQLRDNSAWMFASKGALTAAGIRTWLGDFTKIRNVAKYAARLGQSFSSSTETLTVRRDEIEIIHDIENAAGYLFSDGIGKISAEFARRVAIKCGLKSSTPSAFQIRYGGYKGVVAVDPTSLKKLSLRKSMSKFESENIKLDVLAYTKYQPCFLNRQLITLLSTLGVKDEVFQMKQDEIVKQLDEILTDPERALEAIELMFPGETTNILREMLLCGYKPDSEPFLSMHLQTFRASKLLELRTKSRIFVPKGRAMMGCLDETRTLEYGQVFVQFSRNGHYNLANSESDHRKVVLTGNIVVAKNPCLHPGDIRVLLAVDIPALHHMVDCVVFPQKGKRPHPNECSGSDLDGDIYFVTWDLALIPPREVSPMEYTPAPAETLDHDVTIEEVQEYFTNYIVNETLGIIANAHTVFADKEPLKAESQECIELAKLFSIAVDFPKTGVPAEIPPHLHVKEYPDFMEKLDKETYESQGVIGKLFRAVKGHSADSNHIKAFTKEIARKSYDPDMEVNGFINYLDKAFTFKEDYDYKLGCLMDQYEIKTEAEILSGSIMKMSKTFNKYKDGEALSKAVRSLRKQARGWFNKKWDVDNPYDDDEDAKASAWYHVTYHPDYWGCYNEGYNWPHFLSFAWCVYDKLLIIKQEKMRMKMIQKKRDAARFGSLQQQFGGLGLN
ncbi:uncharacterized protein A4U43_C06F15970 [Asparagus officinalis]|uniref:RNA-dependent RNA polymerase n=1 Tax=Asparagus officinalis TaxID=4686 RepID=A0A5P1EM92_ASPOF|nr:probable RNA-dependent RNA polymerase 1 [Asparagus officinalis]XP_020269098.1 probable RNA-dependent RNA polymerase 1 [Asparagus officinalis]ONK67125.1 uncharacterized protein A4U43_C06F15970 [Asparagus officinalis]